MRDDLAMRPLSRPHHVAIDAAWVRKSRKRHLRPAADPRRTDTEGFWRHWARRQVGSIPETSHGDAVGVLLVHGRPWTLQTQLAAFLQASRIGRVIVSCNMPDAQLGRAPLLRHPRVELRMEDPDRNQLRRFAIAAEQDADRFVLIDDDLYIEPNAIDFLCRALDEEPGTPCGIIGQNWREEGSWDIRVTAWRAHVDILNCVYACTRAHAVRAFELADSLGFGADERYRLPADDVLASFAGSSRPVVHRLAFIRDPAAAAEVATFRVEGFHEDRRRWISQLREITGIPVSP